MVVPYKSAPGNGKNGTFRTDQTGGYRAIGIVGIRVVVDGITFRFRGFVAVAEERGGSNEFNTVFRAGWRGVECTAAVEKEAGTLSDVSAGLVPLGEQQLMERIPETGGERIAVDQRIGCETVGEFAVYENVENIMLGIEADGAGGTIKNGFNRDV